MSYQKNWPTLLAYAVSIAGFVVVAGYALLYATGYRIDFRDWTLRKTGVLAISTKPSGATVYINGRKYARPTPITLRNMLPGTYSVKLELADYRPYNKTIEVVSREVAEEHNLDLVLETVPTQVLAKDVSRVIAVDGETIYFNKQHIFTRLENEQEVPLDFTRLPVNVKSVLQAAADIYMAKKSDGDIWALGIIANGRRWLVVADLKESYRGQLFGAPLNQVTADNLTWVGSDQMLATFGTSLYAVDLNLNRVNQYTKVSLGAGYQNGKFYYVVRGANGKFALMRDGNLFDDKPGEVFVDDLPTAKSYNLLFVNDERVILLARNQVTGLWLLELKNHNDKAVWVKVASNVSNAWYEHHNLKPKLFYAVTRSLFGYDFTTQTEKLLKEFPRNIQLLGKRDESLFIVTDNQLMVSDTAGANIYALGSAAGAEVFLGNDAKHVWLLQKGVLTEWTLRQNDLGIFGGLTNWHWGTTLNTVNTAAE